MSTVNSLNCQTIDQWFTVYLINGKNIQTHFNMKWIDYSLVLKGPDLAVNDSVAFLHCCSSPLDVYEY